MLYEEVHFNTKIVSCKGGGHRFLLVWRGTWVLQRVDSPEAFLNAITTYTQALKCCRICLHVDGISWEEEVTE